MLPGTMKAGRNEPRINPLLNNMGASLIRSSQDFFFILLRY